MTIDPKAIETAYRDLTEGLREDQLKAMACIGELIQEVKAAPEPLAFGVFWMSEQDLLQDRQVTWISNLKRDGIKRLIRHAWGRVCKDEAASVDQLRSALQRAVALYGKPGGPWNVPGDPGGWLEQARSALAAKDEPSS